MLLSEVVAVSSEIAATRSRTAKTELVAGLLRATAPEEVPVVAAYLAGSPRQRRTGLGWRGLEQLPPPAPEPLLTVTEVDGLLEELSRVSGQGSRAVRRDLVDRLFGRATDSEQRFLRALVFENLRQGAQDSVLLEGIARAAEVPAAAVRRAAMFTPSSGEVAAAALSAGRAALDAFGLVPGRPVRPMLASSAPDVDAALARTAGPGQDCLVDRKLDGIRVQVHRTGEEVRVYTRSLDEVTERLPEVVEAALTLPVTTVVLDGEVIALRPDGRPRPFQETASRTGSSASVAELRATTPLTVAFFDILHRDGANLLDAPGSERLDALADTVPPDLLVPRVVTGSPDVARAFFREALAAGHEGVVVKSLTSRYEAGRRGAGWVKVKPRHTLDLVVLAVEWGSGRRQGLLSNIHLGARDPGTGGTATRGKTLDGTRSPVPEGWVPVGKTFKGMTDEMLAWQTERFTELALEPASIRDHHVVPVRPVQVVEVAFDGVQSSSRYSGGVALRFARVVRYRDDKPADEADTIGTLRALS